MLSCISSWYSKANEALKKKLVGQTIYLALPFSIIFLVIQLFLAIYLYYYEFVKFNPEQDYYLVLYFIVVMIVCWVARTWLNFLYERHVTGYWDQCEMDLQFGFFMIVCYVYCTYVVLFLGTIQLFFYFFFLVNVLTLTLYFGFIKKYMTYLDRSQFKSLHFVILILHFVVFVPTLIFTFCHPLIKVQGPFLQKAIYYIVSTLVLLYLLVIYSPVTADLVLISLEGLRKPPKVEPIREVEYGTNEEIGAAQQNHVNVLNPANLA